MSGALFLVLPALLALAGFVEWRKLGAEDRARGRVRLSTSLALAAALVLTWTAAHSIVAQLGWLDGGSAVGWADAVFQLPFVPGRFLMQRLVEPRYRILCPLCVENVLEISLWLDVFAWCVVTHLVRLAVARRRMPGSS